MRRTVGLLLVVLSGCGKSGGGDEAAGGAPAAGGAGGSIAGGGADSPSPAGGSGGGSGGAPAGGSSGEGGHGGVSAEGGHGGTSTDTPPTYYADIGPIFAQRCGRCHLPGGAGPMSLLDLDSARDFGVAALAAIESGRMPPWKPDPDCRHYRDERLMPEAEKDIVRRWVDAGMPAGEVRPVPPPPVSNAGEPDMVARPIEAYVPDDSKPDDYRCFPLDARFDRDTFVVGTDVKPGDRRTVHHVLVFQVNPGRAGDLVTLDARDEGPGYRCFGGAGVNDGGPIAGWVPGQQPQTFEGNTSILVPAGSALVMQVHYNFIAGGAPTEDRTEFHLFTQSEPTEFVSRTRPLANLDIRIPAGEPKSTHVRDFPNNGGQDWVIGATAPHMHMLGKHIRVELLHEGGDSTCLVDIPDWDFNWQQGYQLPREDRLVVRPGESLRLTCEYDNSPANQPLINGQRLPPRDVTWGEGTLDEMCLNFITIIERYEPGASGICGGFDACRTRCADPDGLGCSLDCMAADQACGQCAINGLVGEGGCARAPCGAQLLAAANCLRPCAIQAVATGVSLDACLGERCPTERDTLYACMQPLLDDGSCDAPLGACNIQP